MAGARLLALAVTVVSAAAVVVREVFALGWAFVIGTSSSRGAPWRSHSAVRYRRTRETHDSARPEWRGELKWEFERNKAWAKGGSGHLRNQLPRRRRAA